MNKIYTKKLSLIAACLAISYFGYATVPRAKIPTVFFDEGFKSGRGFYTQEDFRREAVGWTLPTNVQSALRTPRSDEARFRIVDDITINQ